MKNFQYRKRPIVIEAFQWLPENGLVAHTPPWFNDAFQVGKVRPFGINGLLIHTLEGVLYVREKDWIIKGIQCELYPCKPDIFKETYEKETK